MNELFVILILGISIILFAGFIQGLTSFGFALFSIPILSKVIPLDVVVPIITLLCLISNAFIVYTVRRYIHFKEIWILTLASTLAVPLGVRLLIIVDISLLKIAIGVIIICVAVLMLKGVTFHVDNQKIASIPVGFLSGVLNGSLSLSGPPVALFLNNQQVEKQVFRANIATYSLILNMMTIASFSYSGMMNSEVLTYSITFIPAMIIGLIIGINMLKVVNESLFKRITLYLIIASGIWTLISA
ncbi:sulfite exporter TauE/SafE family protein [Evansella cellulosilytica]|uniref:Probable membrane transporter protein n=1 Tax=Evansella cellulosilytica (strain ATCC 21833 / DSM 2522 / FERM P-1141 / JCM 9156 / N-4) TaxID=649639 RepID=E6TT25_EVAC2|nr:sulfite exporter TauE/SafE family protein [Evansella cellulosilytica]ADU31933.1 protein of unknown function DUF81 [Evansella cellulosilytica DSM 2522]